MSIKPNGDTKEAVSELAQSHFSLPITNRQKKVSKLSQGCSGTSYSFFSRCFMYWYPSVAQCGCRVTGTLPNIVYKYILQQKK